MEKKKWILTENKGSMGIRRKEGGIAGQTEYQGPAGSLGAVRLDGS